MPKLSKLEEFHTNMSKAGYEMKPLEEFKLDVENPEILSKIHTKLIKDGYEMKPLEVFTADMTEGLKKKDQTKEYLESFSEDTSSDSADAISPLAGDIPTDIQSTGTEITKTPSTMSEQELLSFTPEERGEKIEEERVSDYKASKPRLETALKEADFLSGKTEDLVSKVSSENNVYESHAAEFIAEKKSEQVAQLSKEYKDNKDTESLDSYIRQGFSKEDAQRVSKAEYNDDRFTKGLSTLGLSAEDSASYGSQLKEYLFLRNKPNKTPEEISQTVALNKSLSGLRQKPNEKAFINPETGEIDNGLKKEVDDLTAVFAKEVKTDFNKFQERYDLEYNKINALTESIKSELPSNLIKNGELPSKSKIEANVALLGDVGDIDTLTKKQQSILAKYEELEKAEKTYTALNRALLLNEDPASVSRGFEFLEGVPVLEELGSVATSLGESFTEALTGKDVVTDKDFRKETINAAKQAGMSLTDKQIESGLDTIYEKAGEGLGGSLEIGLEIGASMLLGNKISSFVRFPKAIAGLKVLQKNPKYAKFADRLYRSMQETAAFEMAGESGFTAQGEFWTKEGLAPLLDKLAGGKLGKFGKFITRATSSIAGGVTEEYAGDWVNEGVKNGFFTKEQAKQAFGEGEGAFEKFLLTMITVGAMSAPVEAINAISNKDYGDPNVKSEIEQLVEGIKEAKDLQSKVKEDTLTPEERAEMSEFKEEIESETKEDVKEELTPEEKTIATEEFTKQDSNGVLEKIDSEQDVNESQSQELTDDLFSKIESGELTAVQEEAAFDLIDKVDNYERKTKTVEETTIETRVLNRVKKGEGKVRQKAVRDLLPGSKAIIKGVEGELVLNNGRLSLKKEDGSYYVGDLTDMSISVSENFESLITNEAGNVIGVKLNVAPENASTTAEESINQEQEVIEIYNEDLALDMGIQLMENQIGEHPFKDFNPETFLEEIVTEVTTTKEVPVVKPKAEPVVEPVVEPVKEEVAQLPEEKESTTPIEEEVLDLDTKDKKNYGKAFNFLDKIDKDLTEFSKESLGMNIPVAALQSVVKLAKVSIKAGVTVRDALASAINEYKKTPEYDSLSNKEKQKVDDYNVDSLFSDVEEVNKAQEETKTKKAGSTLQKKIKALKEKVKQGKSDRKALQDEFLAFIKDNADDIKRIAPKLSPAILKKASQIKTERSLKNAIKYLDKILTNKDFKDKENKRADFISKIGKILTDTKKKGSSVPTGKIAIETQDFYRKALRASTLTLQKAEEMRAKILAKYPNGETLSDVDQENMSALDFADMENQSLDSLEILAQLSKEYAKEGRDRLKKKREAVLEKTKQVNEDVVNAVTNNKPDSLLTDTQWKAQQKKKGLGYVSSRLKEGLRSISGFLNKNEAWKGIIEEINNLGGKENREALKKDLIDPVNEAASKQVESSQKFIKKVRAKKQEIFGKDYKKKIKKNSEQTAVVDSNGDPVLNPDGSPLLMSNDQAMNNYNILKDDTLSDSLESQENSDYTAKAILDESVRRVESNPELQAYADWVVEEFYPDSHKEVNEVFREQYNYNLPQNENYTPIKREGIDTETNPVNLLAPNLNIATTTNGSLKDRVDSSKPIDLSQGIDAVMFNYNNRMSHFINYTGLVRDLNRTFNNRDVKKAIEQKIGKPMNDVIKSFIQDFTGKPITDTRALEALDKIRKNFTTAALGANPSLLLKQLVSFPAYGTKDPIAWTKELSKIATKSFREDFQFLLESDFVQDRRGSGFDRDAALAMKKDVEGLLSGANNFASKAMFLTKWGDVGAIVLGGTPFFRVQKNKYLKEGLSESEAKEKAFKAFEVATKSTQQSANVEEQSYYQRGAGNLGSLSKLFTMFKTSQSQYFRKSRSARRNLIRGRGTMEDVRTLAMFQVVLPALFTAAVKGFTFEEEDLEDYLESIALGNAEGLFLTGDIVSHIADKATGKPFSYSPTPALSGVTKLVSSVAEAISEGAMETADAIESVVQGLEVATGLPIKNLKKLTLDNLEKIGKKEKSFQRKILKLLGYSEYIIDRKGSKKGRKGRKESEFSKKQRERRKARE